MSDDAEFNRRELERRAYGRAETPEQMQDALQAQREMTAYSSAIVPEDAPLQEEPEPTSDSSSSVTSDVDAQPAPVKLLSRPGVVWLAVAGALIVGLAIGHIVALPRAAPRGSTAPTSASSPAALPFRVTAPAAVSVTDALTHWFPVTQLADDKYSGSPWPGVSFDASSTRLISSSTEFGSVWIAKRSIPSSGVCVILRSAPQSDGGVLGALDCASLSKFARSGLTVSSANVLVRWTLSGIELNESQ